MNAVVIIATREIADALRNRWVVAAVLCLGGLATVLAFVGTAPGGAMKASALAIAVANLSSLSVYLLPLIALLLSFDALVGEAERGTLALLLTYPLSRWQVIAGKFAGHVVTLGLAVVIGYGGAGVLVALRAGSASGWEAYVAMMAASLTLGAVFVGIGFVVSALARERTTAIGVTVGTWLAFVVLYDFALLGWLLFDTEQRLSPGTLGALLIANPTDAYRILTLASVDAVSSVTGMSGLASHAGLGSGALMAALGAWIVAPLVVAIACFQRREI